MYLLFCTSVAVACFLCVCPPCLRRIVCCLYASSRARPLLFLAATLVPDDAAASAGIYADDDDACNAAPAGGGSVAGDGACAGACAACSCCCCCRGCCCCFCLLRSLYTDWHNLLRSCHIPHPALIQHAITLITAFSNSSLRPPLNCTSSMCSRTPAAVASLCHIRASQSPTNTSSLSSVVNPWTPPPPPPPTSVLLMMLLSFVTNDLNMSASSVSPPISSTTFCALAHTCLTSCLVLSHLMSTCALSSSSFPHNRHVPSSMYPLCTCTVLVLAKSNVSSPRSHCCPLLMSATAVRHALLLSTQSPPRPRFDADRSFKYRIHSFLALTPTTRSFKHCNAHAPSCPMCTSLTFSGPIAP